ncbi:glycine cleavage system aminomethyltransferase GcvT [Candidatus Margulisiibacteriota bacterium]
MGNKTPLYKAHTMLQARMIDFAGWEMPVYYKGIKEEHFAVRNSAGLFDIGHMGAIKVAGKAAETFLQKLLSNDIAKLGNESAQYSILLNENGGVIDDLFVYKIGDFYMLVTNSINADGDMDWLKSNLIEGVEIKNLKKNMTLLAFQGPKAQAILQSLSNIDLNSIDRHRIRSGKIKHVDGLISRSGYTGEDGFELFLDKDSAEFVWGLILEAGKKEGVHPCGLGARDTLRLEAGLPLYGHEYDEETTPLEAGFSFAVKLEKESFVGKDALLKQKEDGILRRLVGIKMETKVIPRQGYSVFVADQQTGSVTSGTLSPTLNTPIAMCYVKTENAGVGQELNIEIRRKRYPAKVVALPFYKRTQPKPS